MARAQDMLVQSGWDDTTINEVLNTALSPHDGGNGRFDVEGEARL